MHRLCKHYQEKWQALGVRLSNDRTGAVAFLEL